MARGRGRDYEGIIKGIAALVLLAGLATGGIKGAAEVFKFASFAVVAAAVLVGCFMLVAMLIKVITARSAATHPTRFEVAPRPTPSSRFDVVASSPPTSRLELGKALDGIDWFQLEKLVAALFESKGNQVSRRGGAKADGGIDIVVESAASRAAVQCKHWAKWKCGPAVVRELLGAMTHEGFGRGFLICRTATDAARSLAEKENITIVDRQGLLDRIESALESSNSKVLRLLFNPQKLCPKCGATMVRRTAAKGKNMGTDFWGCSTYPKCNQTMRT